MQVMGSMFFYKTSVSSDLSGLCAYERSTGALTHCGTNFIEHNRVNLGMHEKS